MTKEFLKRLETLYLLRHGIGIIYLFFNSQKDPIREREWRLAIINRDDSPSPMCARLYITHIL